MLTTAPPRGPFAAALERLASTHSAVLETASSFCAGFEEYTSHAISSVVDHVRRPPQPIHVEPASHAAGPIHSFALPALPAPPNLPHLSSNLVHILALLVLVGWTALVVRVMVPSFVSAQIMQSGTRSSR